MILDLSEQGVSMQTIVPLEAERRLQLRLDLPDSDTHLETTGYIAWADALGRAGVRFSELPVEARQRLAGVSYGTSANVWKAWSAKGLFAR